ncbi:hypothetical protein TRL7639_00467 [Falsiruegeria litorea R37]|uniref:PhoP regulatory network protein YrbL n=2 Tax=Falsiruegeria litorea TaxID=1280831 RepID=A0A1Y5RME8_9RHOB|nr:hypothetical protein TRL7639_00467 [Falsiruegeria litorea R37]
MLDLTNMQVLKISRNHKIFDHPDRLGMLLKVRRDTPKKKFFRRPAEIRFGNLRQWNREAAEYLSAMNRGCVEIKRLAGFFGFAMTTEGPALVVEKLTGPDGRLAPTAHSILKGLKPDAPQRRELQRELHELLSDLEKAKIIFGDFSLENIVRADERGGRLVVVDGIGERTLFPITRFNFTAFRASFSRRRKLIDRNFELLNTEDGKITRYRSKLRASDAK